MKMKKGGQSSKIDENICSRCGSEWHWSHRLMQ
jgi:hypothetical protein